MPYKTFLDFKVRSKFFWQHIFYTGKESHITGKMQIIIRHWFIGKTKSTKRQICLRKN